MTYFHTYSSKLLATKPTKLNSGEKMNFKGKSMLKSFFLEKEIRAMHCKLCTIRFIWPMSY